MIPEIKRFVRFPRKKFRWIWKRKQRINQIHPKTITEAFKMYEALRKLEVKFEVKYKDKARDKEYYELKGWLQCLHWLAKLQDFGF